MQLMMNKKVFKNKKILQLIFVKIICEQEAGKLTGHVKKK